MLKKYEKLLLHFFLLKIFSEFSEPRMKSKIFCIALLALCLMPCQSEAGVLDGILGGKRFSVLNLFFCKIIFTSTFAYVK